MAASPTDALFAASAKALDRRLRAAGLGPLTVAGDGPAARAAREELAGTGRLEDAGAVLVIGEHATKASELGALSAASGTAVSFSGRAQACPEGVPVGESVPFALLDRFDPAVLGPVPEAFDVLAIVTTFNEADIVAGLLDRLVAGGLRVHVIDNWSSDGTAELVAERAARSHGRISHERFPRAHPSPHFELETLLRRVEEVAEASGATWVVHHDADEIREAPWRRIPLRQALFALDQWGFSVADHTVANFVPVDDTWHAGLDVADHFRYLELGSAPGHFLQEKAWKRPGDGHVEIASSGGHEANLAGKRVFPYKFLTRHYPIRSQSHGQRKILVERRARFSPAERRRGWHAHYDALLDTRFVRTSTAGLAGRDDLDGPLLLQRLTGAGLPGNPFDGEGPRALDSSRTQGATPTQVGQAPFLVRVQSVLYEPTRPSLERFLRTLARSIAMLCAARPGVVVDVALADASPTPVYTNEDIEVARWGFTGTGTRAVYYDHLGDNPGHGGAHNRLFARYGRPEVLVVCNPDTAASPSLLLRLLERLDATEAIGVVEARQLPLEHQKDYDHHRGDTSWASGACFAIDGALFERLGGFDAETFFLYCDDVDLSWRARLEGARVVYEPRARILHDKRLSPQAIEMPSDTEVLHSGLASLLLPWKYSRPELAEAHLLDFVTSPEPIHHKVAQAFEERRQSGRLPLPIDPDHRVGDFSTYAYAPLRFDYLR
jgi:GT2 family glycosyltransferase